jgi:hypothetical protein
MMGLQHRESVPRLLPAWRLQARKMPLSDLLSKPSVRLEPRAVGPGGPRNITGKQEDGDNEISKNSSWGRVCWVFAKNFGDGEGEASRGILEQQRMPMWTGASSFKVTVACTNLRPQMINE